MGYGVLLFSKVRWLIRGLCILILIWEFGLRCKVLLKNLLRGWNSTIKAFIIKVQGCIFILNNKWFLILLSLNLRWWSLVHSLEKGGWTLFAIKVVITWFWMRLLDLRKDMRFYIQPRWGWSLLFGGTRVLKSFWYYLLLGLELTLDTLLILL